MLCFRNQWRSRKTFSRRQVEDIEVALIQFAGQFRVSSLSAFGIVLASDPAIQRRVGHVLGQARGDRTA